MKALLLFTAAVAASGVIERRTIGELGAFRFVAAIACGAVVGRVPKSSNTPYLDGA